MNVLVVNIDIFFSFLMGEKGIFFVVENLSNIYKKLSNKIYEFESFVNRFNQTFSKFINKIPLL